MQKPRSHSNPPKRAPREEQTSSQLCPCDALIHPPAAPVAFQGALRVDDPAPGDDEARLGEHLDRDRPDHPFPRDMLEAAERLLKRRHQPEHQVGGDQVAHQLQRQFLQMMLSVAQREPVLVRRRGLVPRGIDDRGPDTVGHHAVTSECQRSRCSGRAARGPARTRRSPGRPCHARYTDRRTRAAPRATRFR